MKKHIIDETNGFSYTLHGDYYLPDFVLPPETDDRPIGIWGRRHRDYLIENKKAVYSLMRTRNTLHSYLADINEQEVLFQLNCICKYDKMQKIYRRRWTMDYREVNKLIQEKISNADSNTADDVFRYVKGECQSVQLTPLTLGMLFELYADVQYDENDPTSCFTREIPISELINIHPGFQSTNGCQWARSDNSYLGKKYKIKRPKEKGCVVAIQLDGPNQNSVKTNRGIRKDITDTISKQRCVILDVSTNIEVDHKNGKYDTLSHIDKDKQKLSEFQPLSKSANDAKRQHCRECIATGKRYDARRLGYKEGFIVGDENTSPCPGCYWYDPKKFNEVISKDFHKDK